MLYRHRNAAYAAANTTISPLFPLLPWGSSSAADAPMAISRLGVEDLRMQMASFAYGDAMALVRCSLCNHEVHDRTSSCPDCGFPLRTASKTPAPQQSPSAANAPTRRGFSIALALSGTVIAFGSLLPWTIVNGGLFGTVNLERIKDDVAMLVAFGAILSLIGVVTATHGPSRVGGITALCIASATSLIWFRSLTKTLEAIDIVNSRLEPFARGGIGVGVWVLAAGLVVSFAAASGFASKSPP